jgi:hypothetical protein
LTLLHGLALLKRVMTTTKSTTTTTTTSSTEEDLEEGTFYSPAQRDYHGGGRASLLGHRLKGETPASHHGYMDSTHEGLRVPRLFDLVNELQYHVLPAYECDKLLRLLRNAEIMARDFKLSSQVRKIQPLRPLLKNDGSCAGACTCCSNTLILGESVCGKGGIAVRLGEWLPFPDCPLTGKLPLVACPVDTQPTAAATTVTNLHLRNTLCGTDQTDRYKPGRDIWLPKNSQILAEISHRRAGVFILPHAWLPKQRVMGNTGYMDAMYRSTNANNVASSSSSSFTGNTTTTTTMMSNDDVSYPTAAIREILMLAEQDRREETNKRVDQHSTYGISDNMSLEDFEEWLFPDGSDTSHTHK